MNIANLGKQLFPFFSFQAAAEYVKTRLPEVLKQHLQNYEKEKENSLLSYRSILEQQILNVDKEILEKLSATYDEAGEMFCQGVWVGMERVKFWVGSM